MTRLLGHEGAVQTRDQHTEPLRKTQTFLKSGTEMREVESSLQQDIASLMDEFNTWGCSTPPTFEHWIHFLDGVEVLLSNGPLGLFARVLLYFIMAHRLKFSCLLPVN